MLLENCDQTVIKLIEWLKNYHLEQGKEMDYQSTSVVRGYLRHLDGLL